MPPLNESIVAALSTEDFAAVERFAKELIAAGSVQPSVWQALGIAQMRNGRPDDAVKSLEQAIKLRGEGAGLRFELACGLEQLGRCDDAVAHLRHAVALDPQSAEAHINLAALLEKTDALDEALQFANRAVQLDESRAVAHYNLANVLQAHGRLDEAIAAYSSAARLDPKFALAFASRACCNLLKGGYATGWTDYEWRLQTEQVPLTRFPQPRWDGRPLPTGTLLVHGEQGIGDEILFASCLPELVPLVGKVVLVCHPRLARLMARSFPAVVVVGHARQPDGSPPQLPMPIDYQIPAGSLPMYLRPAVEGFPRRQRFLLADPARKRCWQSRYKALGPGLKVGISWRGGGTWDERRKRTTTLAQWREILATPGVQFVDLQYGDCRAELEAARREIGSEIHHFDEGDSLGDLDEFAAKIAALDLVVAIGNATVHLAGALGLPTWCLVPKVPQWRWGIEGDRTPWYSTVRLIRQDKPGDWSGALSRATRELQRHIDNSRLPPAAERSRSHTNKQRTVEIATKNAPTADSHMPAPVAQLLQQATNHFNENRFEEAGQLAEQIFAREPSNLGALRILGVTARKARQLDRSLQLLSRAVDAAPDKAILHFERGITLMEMSRQREAYDCFLETVKHQPTFQPACVNISALLEQQERYEEAIDWARRAVELKPDCHLAHYNLANTLRECCHVAEAIEHYQHAARLNPDYVKARWNLGICHLLLGHFAEAWPFFELREIAEEVKLDKYPQPRWDGSPLDGKTIAVHAEQGIGDEVLFASCFQEVIDRARKTILVCEPRLVKLFARSFPRATVYGWTRRTDWSAMRLAESVDFQIAAGSLPLHLRSTAESFPQREQFLTADPQLVQHWRERFAALGPRLKIGLSWRAGGKANEGRKRTIPLTDWREILTTSGAHFVNLQYGDTSEDVAAVQNELGVTIHDWQQGDPLVDMDDYAAKIAALDLVISVGNATVHLAGAVGTPAWTLLPRVPSWRWMIGGEVSPWYPSVRLFRQPRRCNWQPVLEQISSRLHEIATLSRSGALPHEVVRSIREVMPVNEPAENVQILRPSIPSTAWMDAKELACRQPLQVINTLYEQARVALQAGDTEQAEHCYREILQVTPRHMKAHAGIGHIARLTGRLDLAIRSLRRAVSMFESHAGNHAELAAALNDVGQPADAMTHARRAIELEPNLAAGHLELGRALDAQQQYRKALNSLRQALTLAPNDASALAAFCRSLAATGQLDEAVERLQQAIKIAPHQPALHLALGEILLEDQSLDEAKKCFDRAIELNPGSAQAHYQLARLHAQRKNIDQAIAANRQALQCAPEYLPAMLDLAKLLRSRDLPSEAELLYRRAIESCPDRAELHNSLGATLAEIGRLSEAITEYDRALRLEPQHPAANANRGLTMLEQGDFAAGWKPYEWRWRAGQSPRCPIRFEQPLWDGSSLTGRTILIDAEQGVGDEIMFATCYADAIAQAKLCVVLCEARLERLFRRSFPQAIVLAIPQGAEHSWRLPPQLAIDVQCPAGSLPLHLRRSAAAFPRQPQLLLPDPDKVAAWREKLAALGAGKKIGISWRTGKTALNHSRRTTALADWASLLAIPGIHWINLQYGEYRGELAMAAAQHAVPIHEWPETNHRYDLDGLAAKIAALDLVVTVDNTCAHLAGAVGMPTWIALPHPAGWRWQSDRDDSLWYASVRLFRQSQMGNWDQVFRQMREELLKRSYRLDEHSKIDTPSAPHWRHSQPAAKSNPASSESRIT